MDTLRDSNGMIRDDYRIACTLEGLSVLDKLYGFKIHGDTATEIDLEFPDIRRASGFWESFQDHGWAMRLRDAVTRFDQPVTVIITKYVHWAGRTFGELTAEEKATVSAHAIADVNKDLARMAKYL